MDHELVDTNQREDNTVPMHTAHEDSHHSGLNDECQACQSNADTPGISLDADNLLRIWSGTIITKTDMRAYNNLYRSVNAALGLLDAIDRIEDPNGETRKRISRMFYDHGGKA